MAVEVLLSVVVLGVALCFMIVIYASRYRRVPPKKATVVCGRCMRPRGQTFKVITGRGKFIAPIIETHEFLSLEPFSFSRDLEDVVADARDTSPPIIKVHIEGVARISDDPEGLRSAASRFLHRPIEEVRRIVEATVEGHTRGLIAANRPGTADGYFVQDVIPRVAEDLRKIGIMLIGDLVIRHDDIVKDAASVSAQRLMGEVGQLKWRGRRLEDHLGMTRVEGEPPGT